MQEPEIQPIELDLLSDDEFEYAGKPKKQQPYVINVPNTTSCNFNYDYTPVNSYSCPSFK